MTARKKKDTRDLWTQLKAAIKKDPHYDLPETQRLVDLRRMETEAELPHPTCCDSAKKFLYGYREFDFSTSEEPLNGGVPVWRISFPTERDSELKELQTVHYCPFCGAKLPRLRKKANPPPHLVVEGDFSCGGCGERFGRYGSCYCSHPVSAFEPVPEGSS